MIEFDGKLTGASRKFLLKRQKNMDFLFLLLMVTLCFPFIFLTAVFFDPIAWLLMVGFLLPFVVWVFPISKKQEKKFMPQKIFLDFSDQTIVRICEEKESFHMFDSVKSVLDYGEFYHFSFYVGDRDPYFVCQKSLLSKGTLEEFESLFDGKIMRKVR